MSSKSPRTPTKSPTPEIEPSPGSLPKTFPENPEPLSSQGQTSPDESSDSPARSGSGEDNLVESGLPENDPEQPKQSDEDKSME